MRASINASLVKSLPLANTDIRDTKVRGFLIRCRATGKHSYCLQYGRGRIATIGSVHELKPAEARAEAIKILADYSRGVDPQAKRREAQAHTWGSYLREVYAPWMLARPGRRRGEVVQRLQANFKELDKLTLSSITPWNIERFRSARLKAGIKPSTINRDVTDIKSALSRAVTWNLLEQNPLARVKPLKIDKKPTPRYLTGGERSRLMEALSQRDARIKQERERANAWRRQRGYEEMHDLSAGTYADYLSPLVLLLLNTGLRRGEVFNLKWSDINLKGRMLTVQGSNAKSGQSRHVPLNDVVLGALIAWRNQTTGQGLVFPSDTGQPFVTIKKAWRSLLKAAEIKSFRLHDCRHDFASRLVMAGVPLNTVRDLLGHSDLKTTLIYSHLSPDVRADAVAKLCEAS